MELMKGCLCYFYSGNSRMKVIGVLTGTVKDRDNDTLYICDGTQYYDSCIPVKKEGIIFYEDKMEQRMRELAQNKGVECTETLPKIVKARLRFKIGIETCPCAKEDPDRGCISDKCYSEIINDGICHCRCYRRKDD